MITRRRIYLVIAIIIVHGSGGCRHDESNLMAAGILHRNGFNAFIIDLREFGDSEVDDSQHTGGNLESRDVLGAWDWLVETKGFAPESIGFWGLSFGAGVISIAASAEPKSSPCGWTAIFRVCIFTFAMA